MTDNNIVTLVIYLLPPPVQLLIHALVNIILFQNRYYKIWLEIHYTKQKIMFLYQSYILLILFGKIVSEIDNEKLICAEDLNGHVGSGFEDF